MKKIINTIFFIVIVFILITLFFSYLILNSGNILHNFDFIKVGVLVTPPVLLAFILFNFILFKRDFKFIIKNIKGKIK